MNFGNGKWIVLAGMFFLNLAFLSAENTGSSGLTDTQVNQMVKGYLLHAFSTYLKQGNLDVSEISCTPDYKISTNNDFNYYDIQGRFRNFPVNNKIISGRVETKVTVRLKSGQVLFWGGQPAIEPNDQKYPITLYVDDQLSDELRDSLVRNYINQNYRNPLDISIKKERLQIFPDKIYSYVSFIIDKATIYYLRVVFEKEKETTTPIDNSGKIMVKETQWKLNRAETIASSGFPSTDTIIKDLRDEMFGYANDLSVRNTGQRGDKGLSKIESIATAPSEWLLEASDGRIKLSFNMTYLLDWQGFLGSSRTYTFSNVIAIYEFDIDKERWKFISIDKTNITSSVGIVK